MRRAPACASDASRSAARRGIARLRAGSGRSGAEHAARLPQPFAVPATCARPRPIFSPSSSELDAAGAATIAVEPVPAEGLGEAINDRLARAAAPRDSGAGHGLAWRPWTTAPPWTKPSPDRFAEIVGARHALRRASRHRALSGRASRAVARPHRPGAAARQHRGGEPHPQRSPARRARRWCRRAAIPGSSAAQVPDASGREIIVSLSRLDRIRELDPTSNTVTAEAGVVLQTIAGGGRRRRPAVSAVARLAGKLPDRRQPVLQCRRHRRARLRQCTRAVPWRRGGAAGRAGAGRSAQAEEGQYRLRPEGPVHRRRGHARHHHRRGA